jgi:hypothetical protein
VLELVRPSPAVTSIARPYNLTSGNELKGGVGGLERGCAEEISTEIGNLTLTKDERIFPRDKQPSRSCYGDKGQSDWVDKERQAGEFVRSVQSPSVPGLVFWHKLNPMHNFRARVQP